MSSKLWRQAQFHGSTRLVDSKHRYIWIVIQFALLYCSSAVIWGTVSRYLCNPTYMVQLTSIREWITFPTVVICPEINFSQEKVDEFLGTIRYPPVLNTTYIGRVIRQLAAFYSRDVTYEVEDLRNIEDLLEYNDLDVETAGSMLTATCEETLIKCFWRGENTNCTTLFQMEMTSYGFCCMFNGRSLKREMKIGAEDRPVQKLHISQVGRYNGLTIAIAQNVKYPQVNTDLYYKWISIKNNGNYYVDTISNGTPVPLGMEMWAGYSTKGIHISDEVRDLSHDLRRCRMTNEPLEFFPEYHRTYCIMECEMARVLDRCNCSQVQHPELPGVQKCGAEDISCARSSAVPYGVGVCNCPMTCDRDSQITSPFTFAINPNAPSYDTFYENLDLNKVSIVRLYLQQYNKMIYSRRSYFTRFNLFAQLGGVFNVFFGCSVLTLLEVLMLTRRAASAYFRRF